MTYIKEFKKVGKDIENEREKLRYMTDAMRRMSISSFRYQKTRCDHCGCESNNQHEGDGCHACSRGIMIKI